MGTRGTIGFFKDGNHKVTYNHFDSYPDGLGATTLDFIRETSVEQMNEMFDGITMINAEHKPSPEQIIKCKDFLDLEVSGQSVDDWYCLLRGAQGDLAAYGKVGFMIEGETFLHDSLFCEYAYIINLDANTLEYYEGFQESKPNGRYSDVEPNNGYFAVNLVKTTPLGDIAELTLDEICPESKDE